MAEYKIYRNTEGYADPTAYATLKNVRSEDDPDYKRFQRLLNTIFAICELSGFYIQGRIVIKDTRTGQIYR